MARCPFAEWIPSPNFNAGRPATVLGAMQHSTVGSWDSALATLTTPNGARSVSAHFLVGLDGRLAQMVDTNDQAWHALACNARWVGIEFVDDGDHADPVRTPEQYEMGARLNRWIATAHTYTPSDTTIRRHSTCVATACPSGLDVERIIAETLGGTLVPTQAEWNQHLADTANTFSAVKSLLNPIATWVFNAPNRPLGARGRRAFERALLVLDHASEARTVRPAKKPTRAQVRAGHGKGKG